MRLEESELQALLVDARENYAAANKELDEQVALTEKYEVELRRTMKDIESRQLRLDSLRKVCSCGGTLKKDTPICVLHWPI